MIEKIRALAKEYEDLNEQLKDTAIHSDPKKIATIGKRIAELEPLIIHLNEYDECQKAIVFANSEIDDNELKEMAEEEANSAKERLKILELELQKYLVPKDPDDDRSVILEIRAGTGGEEAALFAAELLRMYLRFAEEMSWKTELMNKADADAGGIKEAICSIEGNNVYGALKFESGVHRVQRIPATENKGRVHTSAASVAILPKVEDVDVVINEADLRIDVFRSSGPGGQSVNTTDSAVRISHEPTGITVSCQDEKSQLKNKNKALGILRSRLYEHEKEKQAKERGDMRSGQIGSGDRSEKIRTYNFPQDRVTDHRLGKNFNNITGVMEGEIKDILEALHEKEVQDALARYTK
ncbi:MAG: peptide chain release factor 1 [Candidatus Peribacteraceae bacterium]|nr:peptide chain release factor 1 [Candidatus Peribacteraceae bacterium]